MHVVVVGSVELIEPRCSSAVLERKMSYTKMLLPALLLGFYRYKVFTPKKSSIGWMKRANVFRTQCFSNFDLFALEYENKIHFQKRKRVYYVASG